MKLGTIQDLAPVPIPWKLGVPNLGGLLVTASGLIFIGATMDDFIHAFDIETGKKLWKGRLPAGGQATPMTYRLRRDGKQYVVISAGGGTVAGARRSVMRSLPPRCRTQIKVAWRARRTARSGLPGAQRC